jgi:molybdopterin molybdotransferase
MITVQEAHEIIRGSLAESMFTEQVPLQKLAGRVLAADIFAGFPMPRFTNSAMDGFAVMLDDIATASPGNPARLTVTQEIPAGAQSTMRLDTGTCARIMTGAPMPDGADTVVPFEETSGFGSRDVEFYRAPERGANIRHAGEEVVSGDRLIAKGSRATPAEIAILAAFGVEAPEVYRKPRVMLLTVGDELRMPGEPADQLAIYNSNLPMLQACVSSAEAELAGSCQLSDDPGNIRKTIESSLKQCDMLVTTGGISTGQYDFVRETLHSLGVEEKFWKVAQKPGKPLYFGVAPSGSLVFSLPGNPVSSLACFLEYCLPTLARMQGGEPPTKVEALLAEPFPAERKRHRFLFGTVRAEGGRLFCSVSARTESHMLTATTGANCIVEYPPSAEPLPAGSLVTCSLLPWALGC